MTADLPPLDRLYELLADRATQGLSADEERELQTLLVRFPDVDDESFDRAAAAVALALDPPTDEMPAALKDRLLAVAPNPLPRPTEPARRRVNGVIWAAVAGWAVAAGLAGVVIWANWPESIEARRNRLAADPSTARYAARPGPTTGEIVWNPAKQEGYLEVRGLPPNDPQVKQYQLWIVDAGRPGSAPVDGGVFDVRPDGTALVPVRAPIRVFKAGGFAVTAEQAGGVVVSKGPHLIELAPQG